MTGERVYVNGLCLGFLMHTELTSDAIHKRYQEGPADQFETTQIVFHSVQDILASNASFR